MSRLGKALREFRLANNLSQAQIAKKLRLKNRASVAHIERGKGVSTATLKRIAHVIDVPAGDLL